MFKKIINNFIERLNEIKSEIIVVRRDVMELAGTINDVKQSVKWCNPEKSHALTIEEQQKTIRLLTEALAEKYEHGLFICSRNGEYPLVIRDGKELVDDFTNSFSIEWSNGEFPNINIIQSANGFED